MTPSLSRAPLIRTRTRTESPKLQEQPQNEQQGQKSGHGASNQQCFSIRVGKYQHGLPHQYRYGDHPNSEDREGSRQVAPEEILGDAVQHLRRPPQHFQGGRVGHCGILTGSNRLCVGSVTAERVIVAVLAPGYDVTASGGVG